MTVDLRIYAGFAGQAGRLSAVRHELEGLLRPVVGLRRFLLLQTSEGLATITEADSRAACEDCARRAEQWMQARLPALAGHEPLAVAGDVIVEAVGAAASTRNAS